jgi:cell division protein FtsI (penicillin-binding protein 3)
MASYPGFDPNLYREAPQESLANIPVQHLFEPGSTFKLITAAAALEAGAVDPFDRFDCGSGGINYRGKYIRDHASFADLSFAEIIAFSSNVGAIHLGSRVGKERLHRQIRAFGFGDKTGIDLSGEASGIVHPVEAWGSRDIAYISFGQGISISPLQLANAFAAIANGGVLYRPFVVAASGRDGVVEPLPGRPELTGRPISATTARTLERMLETVVEHERGTGRKAAIPGYRVAGKTGTAENPHGEAHGWFIGYAPAEDPKIVVGAFFEFGLHGSTVAPYVARVIRRYLEGIDPALRGATIRVEFPADSAPGSLLVIPDSGGIIP